MKIKKDIFDHDIRFVDNDDEDEQTIEITVNNGISFTRPAISKKKQVISMNLENYFNKNKEIRKTNAFNDGVLWVDLGLGKNIEDNLLDLITVSLGYEYETTESWTGLRVMVAKHFALHVLVPLTRKKTTKMKIRNSEEESYEYLD